MPSLVAEIGEAIGIHLKSIGMLEDSGLDEHQQKLVDEKRAEFEALRGVQAKVSQSDFPDGAETCAKCMTRAVVMLGGCRTCLSCGDSKCG